MIEWAFPLELPEPIIKKLEKIKKNRAYYNKTLQNSEAHRTSNMLLSLMIRQDKYLYNTQYFQGNNLKTAELRIKAWALIHNFAPYDKRVIVQNGGWQSPAEKFNQFRYHNNWLQNLLISANRTQFL